MHTETLRSSFAHIGLALREPEEFAARWHERDASYAPATWLALAMTGAAGTLGYGMTMGMGQGLSAVGSKAILLTIAAGAAWGIPLPALYILNSLGGSRLRPSTTLLAALVTTSWGGLALLASVPINWFFTAAVPDLPALSAEWSRRIIVGVNLLVFTGVGISMADVFGRVMARLEPNSGAKPTWVLALVAMIGSQFFYLFHLFAA
ncbi:MAG TPA: hypothetical protein VHV77_07900 [Pirellulales bacterium]|nr:hypothetical protein [Pirellulales bacterium]